MTSPGIDKEDRAIVTDFSPPGGETGTWKGLSGREQMILGALAHYVYKDHDFRMDCHGCLDAAAWLTMPGYNGHLQAPLVH